jgi:transcriptional regulator with XRE-family HTH domain
MRLDIKSAMKRRKMNQTELAEAVGIQRSYMSELINGKKQPSMALFTRLVDVLKVSPDDFLRQDAPKTPEERGQQMLTSLLAFEESETVPFDRTGAADKGGSRHAAMMRACRALAPETRSLDFHLVARNMPSLGLLKGDAVVLDMNPLYRDGDLVIANAVDANGTGMTLIREYQAPFLVARDPGFRHQVLNLEKDAVSVLAKIVASFRAAQLAPQEA